MTTTMMKILILIFAQLGGTVEYTDCISVEGYPNMSVLDMTLNNLMVRLQQYWRFRESGVPFHCDCSKIQPSTE